MRLDHTDENTETILADVFLLTPKRIHDSPLDVCKGCALKIKQTHNIDAEVLHPPYLSWPNHYFCFVCNKPLDEYDYGTV